MKKNKTSVSTRRKRRSTAKYLEGGGESQYARKKAYCHKNGVWGFEVPEPKPWRSSK